MLIDCDSCAVRGQACGECVVSVLFGAAPPAVGGAAPPAVGGPAPAAEPDGAERRALQVLADAGFEVTVLGRDESRPHLRLVGGARRRRSAA
jgi:hypothetical protein